jgi:putative addiction module component (TIGR02574 family)
MDTLNIRQKLHEYIDMADDKEVAALYAGINEEAPQPYEWWNDDELVAELERRAEDLRTGKDPGFTWEQSRENLMARLKRLSNLQLLG